MTQFGVKSNRKCKVCRGVYRDFFIRAMGSLRSVFALCLLLFFTLFLSREAGEYAIYGIRLAVFTVLPSAVTSMLICDLYRRYGFPERIPLLGRILSVLFGGSGYGLRAFVLGNLCGFPMGAREVGAAYSEGLLSKEEAEHLLPVSTNPSPAFVIGAVGGMMGDFRFGVMLFCCVLLSSVLCGAIFRIRGNKKRLSGIVLRQNYSFVESISSVGGACIRIISFVSAFSVILGFVEKYVTVLPIKYAIFSVMEVTGAIALFTTSFELSPAIMGSAVAFSLGFGGISVMLQSAAFASDFGLKMKGYFRTKIIQGLLCAFMWVCGFLLFFE